ncbi:type II toxin-antitoxin system HicB family antitoxin [Levilactobacillus cerevisiae]|uniref:type II toxin-antitoxin system HicB family antitoxin n=1 Tax=Levilactobacillus cerevisiae TaxID=1704076 RepID=UPI000F793734|nr:type II toxin-antitoxin system HicB family antitoxin [Levilactobacillus cerevisiae]
MTDKLVYPIIAQENNDEDGHYYVGYSPNIPGMVTQADSLVELAVSAEDAIATMLDGKKLPEVQDPKTWHLQTNESTLYVSVDMDAWAGKSSKKVKRSITVPEYLNDMAKKRKINVSRLTTDALEDIYNSVGN